MVAESIGWHNPTGARGRARVSQGGEQSARFVMRSAPDTTFTVGWPPKPLLALQVNKRESGFVLWPLTSFAAKQQYVWNQGQSGRG